jgi:hypothetical protein
MSNGPYLNPENLHTYLLSISLREHFLLTRLRQETARCSRALACSWWRWRSLALKRPS